MTRAHIYAVLSALELTIFMTPWATEAWWHRWMDAGLLGFAAYFALCSIEAAHSATERET